MDVNSKLPITILGSGAWGTALALYLSRLGQEVRIWTVETDNAEEMIAERTNNRYMPGYPFPETLKPFVKIDEALQNVSDILIAVPSVGYRSTLNLIKPLLKNTSRIISVTKGLDLESGQLLHDVAKEVLGSNYPYAVLSGPSFAKEVAAGLPTAVMIASQDQQFAKDLFQRFSSAIFRVTLSRDLTGVEIGGVTKNVIAIATGISDGMGYGSNARCALITYGLEEITRLGTKLGGESETFSGLAGIGDLVLTCSDDQSRNRRFGLALGKGKNPAEIEREIGAAIEGKRNAELVVQLAKKMKVDMPISEMVWKIIQGKMTAQAGIDQLFAHEDSLSS